MPRGSRNFRNPGSTNPWSTRREPSVLSRWSRGRGSGILGPPRIQSVSTPAVVADSCARPVGPTETLVRSRWATACMATGSSCRSIGISIRHFRYLQTQLFLVAASECEVQVAAVHRRWSVLLRDSRIIDMLRLLLATLSWSEECEAAINAREWQRTTGTVRLADRSIGNEIYSAERSIMKNRISYDNSSSLLLNYGRFSSLYVNIMSLKRLCRHATRNYKILTKEGTRREPSPSWNVTEYYRFIHLTACFSRIFTIQ